jgi:hypothetical protein
MLAREIFVVMFGDFICQAKFEDTKGKNQKSLIEDKNRRQK